MSEPSAESLLETARPWLPLVLSAAAAVFLGRFLTWYVKCSELFDSLASDVRYTRAVHAAIRREPSWSSSGKTEELPE